MESHRRRDRSKSKYAWFILCLGVGINQGCARPDAPNQTQISAASPPAEQNLPFHQNPDHATDDSAHPAVPADRKAGSGTPFRAASHSNTRNLPAGTLITVRLESSLPISRVRAGDAFSASVAGPVTIDGDTIVERGTPVNGCVESAQLSVDRPGFNPDPGFVRLILKTITVDGAALALQTSSLFAKGTWQSSADSVGAGSDAGPRSFWVQKGRRLTFRLTAPVRLTGPNSVANRQYTSASSE